MPNILITGTPGTGKSRVVAELVRRNPELEAVQVSELVAKHGFHEGRDAVFDALLIDEDKLLDYMEDELKIMTRRSHVVEFHGSELFPERWFDLVVVLRTESSILYGRLEERGYPQRKIVENLDAEIFQVVLDETVQSYRPDIVLELANDVVEDLGPNLEKIQRVIEGVGRPPRGGVKRRETRSDRGAKRVAKVATAARPT